MNKCKYIEYKYLIEKTTTHKKTQMLSPIQNMLELLKVFALFILILFLKC